MPNVNVWMTDAGKGKAWVDDIEDGARSQHFGHRTIEDKPYDIVIQRGTTTLASQRVRLEMTRIEPYETIGAAGRQNRANIFVLGYRDHPTLPDLDIASGDVFVALGSKFRVRQVYRLTPGLTEAWGDLVE